MRRGARVAESGGLENRCARKGTVGSNPTLSATTLRLISYLRLQAWRGAGVAELAALEMLCTGNCTVGSNPTLSATLIISSLKFQI